MITISDKVHIVCQDWGPTSNFLTLAEQFENLRPHDNDKHKWKLKVIFWFDFIGIILPGGLRWSRMIRTTNRLRLGIIVIQWIRITWIIVIIQGIRITWIIYIFIIWTIYLIIFIWQLIWLDVFRLDNIIDLILSHLKSTHLKQIRTRFYGVWNKWGCTS